MESVLIFGGRGQDGVYLRRLCEQRGMRVVTASRSGVDRRGSIADFEFVDRLVAEVAPDAVFHLAACSSTAHEVLRENHATIATGTWNVCDAVERHCPGAKVFLTGSGLQFENHGEPIDEGAPFAATSPYAVERIHSVYAARYYRSRGLRTCVGYLFHHDSPLRASGHLSMRIARAARRIAAGEAEPLEVGAPEVEKEWGFAGDVAAGILVLASQDEVHEAVIGTGIARPVSDWIEACFARIGLDPGEWVRPLDGYEPEFDRLVSDPATMHSLGWQPQVDFDALCDQIMESAQVSVELGQRAP